MMETIHVPGQPAGTLIHPVAGGYPIRANYPAIPEYWVTKISGDAPIASLIERLTLLADQGHTHVSLDFSCLPGTGEEVPQIITVKKIT